MAKNFKSAVLAPILWGLSCWPGLAADPVQDAVDQSIEAVRAAALEVGLSEVVEIDHARLAAAEGAEMPPARVLILSDPVLNTEILQQNVRAGLDLPMRVLFFDNNGSPKAIHTEYAFIAQRHGLGGEGDTFDARISNLMNTASVTSTPAPEADIEAGFGIVELTSQYGFDETILRLREAVMSQGDTVWFGDIDFTAEASSLGVDLQPAMLLLFGGPAPGGVAMNEFPAIGLDAFCQKLLVYGADDGRVHVLFNDIAALAELHYGNSAKPHHGLNERLTATFTAAVE